MAVRKDTALMTLEVVAPKPRRKSVTLAENEELRGFVVRLYPTQEQTKWLYQCQREMRAAWNYLVVQNQAHTERCIAKAVADGALIALPERPGKGAALRDLRAWNKLHDRSAILASKHVRGDESYCWPKLSMRAECYQPVMVHVREALERAILQCDISAYRAVIARFSASRVPKKGAKGWKPPRWKRDAPPWLDYTMIQVRDGRRLREEGGKDCTLVLFGERIAAHAGRPLPEGAPVEGCSLVRKADGWYAAIRSREPARVLPEPKRGAVAICLGIVDLVVTSDGRRWENPRGNEYAKLIAFRDERAAEFAAEGLHNEAFDLRMQNKRYMLHYARKATNLIYTEILPALAEHDTIVIGSMSREDVQGPKCALSEDDDGGGLSSCGILRSLIKQRYPSRVAEVALPGIDDDRPEITARNLLAMWADLQGE